MPSKPSMVRRPARSVGFVRPALLTGTSSEYLGRRPLPRIVQERSIVFVLGPNGVGRTSVAERLASAPMIGRVPLGEVLRLDAAMVQNALVERVALRRWPDRLVEARSLILDGPCWLRSRPAAVDALIELLIARLLDGRRTVLCQSDDDGSLDVLLGAITPGTAAVIGLRFPKGPRGRLRFARRVCDEAGVPRSMARTASEIEPWSYDAAIAAVHGHVQRRASG